MSDENVLETFDSLIGRTLVIEFFGFVEWNEVYLCRYSLQKSNKSQRVFVTGEVGFERLDLFRLAGGVGVAF